MRRDGVGRRRLNADVRRAQIIDVARKLLVDNGYDAVTLRAVATGAGISLSGLQHFYADKATLVEAMVDGIGAEYDEVYDDLANEVHGDVAALRNFVRYIVLFDIQKPETAGFFFEMWRLAHREPAANIAVSNLYANQLARMAILVNRANPHLGSSEAAARAAIIMGSTDGFMNTIGFGKTRPAALADVQDEQLVDLLVGFATMPTSGGGAQSGE
jgi:AcrR family transcriptional regulator